MWGNSFNEAAQFFWIVRRDVSLTYENSSGHFEDGGEDAGGSDGEDFGADGRPEGVGHVIGSDAEGEHESHQEADDHQPQDLRRVRLHICQNVSKSTHPN